MKLFYRGINQFHKVATMKTNIVEHGKYRGATIDVHSSTTPKKHNTNELKYRGISY